MNLELSQIISQILAFLIMIFVLKKYAWKPILNVLEMRKEKIASEFIAIEVEKSSLKALQNEQRRVLKELEASKEKILKDELEKAKRVSNDLIKAAEIKAKEMLDQIKEELQFEVTKAKNTLKNEMIQLIVHSTEVILKEKMSDDLTQKQYIEELK